MGEIIAITGGKGGVGKSFVAIGLSTALSRMGKGVLLIDADNNLGYDAELLNVRPLYFLRDVQSGKCKLNQAYTYCLGGFRLIASGNCDGEIKYSLDSILGVCKKKFDYVIIDYPAGVSSNGLSKVDSAILVTEPKTGSIKSSLLVKDILQTTGIKDISLFINKITKDDFFSIKDVESSLQLPIIGNMAQSNDIGKFGDSMFDITKVSKYRYLENTAAKIVDPEVKVTPIKRSFFSFK
mgnify:CR=1 FL=1